MDEIGAGPLFAEFFASSLDSQGLTNRAVAETAGDAIIEEIKVVILEFDHLSAVHADEVVVSGAVNEVWIVSGLAIAELDLVDEICFGEKSEGAINGGARSLGS